MVQAAVGRAITGPDSGALQPIRTRVRTGTQAMIHSKTLIATLLALAAGAAAAPALAAPGAPVAADPMATASCIARQLPQGARLFRASDGSLRVQSIGRRGNAAQWIIAGSPAAVQVTRDRGAAGIERTVAGTCY